MEERGIPREGGPIGVMLNEHDYGRKYTRGMEEAAQQLKKEDESTIPQIIENARNYAQLLTEHIYKENNILYPLVNRVFTAEDQKQLHKYFDEAEKKIVQKGFQEKYQEMVENLEKNFK